MQRYTPYILVYILVRCSDFLCNDDYLHIAPDTLALTHAIKTDKLKNHFSFVARHTLGRKRSIL